VVTFDCYRVQFVVFDEQILLLADFESATLFAGLNRLASNIVDALLPQTIADTLLICRKATRSLDDVAA
jgi:hypothetical protein